MAELSPLLIVCFSLLVSAQIPIPKRELGYAYNSGLDTAAIHLDVFIDLICPDSKKAFPTLLTLADYYGPQKLQLKLHIFPLPYHRNAWLTSKGAHIIASTTQGNETFAWIDTLFNNMESLTSSSTTQYSDDQMAEKIADLANSIGIDRESFLSTLLNDISKEYFTRTAWKYACTRGVAETPTFFVNGIMSYSADSEWTVDDWKKLIDPLKPSQQTGQPPSPEVQCPEESKACNQNKTTCCNSTDITDTTNGVSTEYNVSLLTYLTIYIVYWISQN